MLGHGLRVINDSAIGQLQWANGGTTFFPMVYIGMEQLRVSFYLIRQFSLIIFLAGNSKVPNFLVTFLELVPAQQGVLAVSTVLRSSLFKASPCLLLSSFHTSRRTNGPGGLYRLLFSSRNKVIY